jgi:hypothetical protein
MPIVKKNTARKRARKNDPTLIMVTKTFVPVEEAIFPEKAQKVKDVLTKAKFRSSK